MESQGESIEMSEISDKVCRVCQEGTKASYLEECCDDCNIPNSIKELEADRDRLEQAFEHNLMDMHLVGYIKDRNKLDAVIKTKRGE